MRIYIEQLWRRAKMPFSLQLGPVQLLMHMRRSVRVSNNRRRRDLHARAREAPGSDQGSAAAAPSVDLPTARTAQCEVAIIVGAGSGFGYGLATRLASAGMRVALVSRNAESHDSLVGQLRAANPWVRAYGCDATSLRSVSSMLAHAVEDLGEPTLVVYAVQHGGRGKFLDTEPAAFEDAWRANCLGGFIVAREAGRRMVQHGSGTIVLVGATSGLLGRAGYINFAPGKFGLRAVSQVAARELSPLGVHVVHLVIDAEIAEGEGEVSTEPEMLPTDIAEIVYQLHRQPRSAWTQELDVRPHNERFWEHC